MRMIGIYLRVLRRALGIIRVSGSEGVGEGGGRVREEGERVIMDLGLRRAKPEEGEEGRRVVGVLLSVILV
jgi:hypothetical protein